MFPGQVYRPQCRAMGPRQIVPGMHWTLRPEVLDFPGAWDGIWVPKSWTPRTYEKNIIHTMLETGNLYLFGGRYANKVRLKFHRCSRKIYLYTNKSKMSSWFWFLFTHTVATEAPTTFWQCLSWHFGNRAYATVVYRGNGEIPSPQEMASQRHSPRMMRRDQTPKDF